jgi:hypothetical protein
MTQRFQGRAWPPEGAHKLENCRRQIESLYKCALHPFRFGIFTGSADNGWERTHHAQTDS